MAALKDFVGCFVVAAILLVPLGCGKAVGLGGTVVPLEKIQVQVSGDPAQFTPAGDTPSFRVALVWGLQWQPEPFCVLPPESPEAAAVIAAGCPDSFGFVPNRAGADIPFQPGTPATLTLDTLPAADVMAGDLNGRVAYGSLIVYDDRNNNGALDLSKPPRVRRRDLPKAPPTYDDGGPTGPADMVYGASFISMTLPDQRVTYLEGKFDAKAAFYPRNCDDPPTPGFSIQSAGGFAQADGGFFQGDGGIPLAMVGELAEGYLPAEGPPCTTGKLEDTVVTISLQTPANLTQLACTANDSGGATTYREAPDTLPVLTGRQSACVDFPYIPGDDAGVATGKQFVISSAPGELCRYTIHYTLRGCENDPSCAAPSWDITATPPNWWHEKCPTWP
jgi:hypothetical protein